MRIILADGHPEVRSALRLLLEEDPGTTIVGEAATTENLIEQTGTVRPEMVLLDCDLQGLSTSDLMAVLRSISPGLLVIALCGRPENRQPALLAGVDAFVSKGEAPERLLATIAGCCGKTLG